MTAHEPEPDIWRVPMDMRLHYVVEATAVGREKRDAQATRMPRVMKSW